MPAANLLALLDDIASVLDDVAIMTKTAAKKTAGVLGDDLALNAQQVSGIGSERELPVVWAVAKGSLVNKLILVPAALLISAWIPQLITPLLVLGGLYLCYEGIEKCWHALSHRKGSHSPSEAQATQDAQKSPPESEQQKIRGAIRTDFILSAEIIVIALGVIEGKGLLEQCLTLSVVAIAMTVGVYGLVAAIVRLDDWGAALYAVKEQIAAKQSILDHIRKALGSGILWLAPRLMNLLAWVGTAAMFLVGGGILSHSLPVLHHTLVDLPLSGFLMGVVTLLAEGLTGAIAGFILFIIVTLFTRMSQLLR